MIADLYDGDVGAFLAGETTVFDDIQSVLAQQFSRLTPLEWQIMFWLAVEREATPMPALAEAIRLPHRPGDLPVAMRSLQRRSLIERQANGFGLQNVVMEFTTAFLVGAIVDELVAGEPNFLAHIPLLKAQSRTFIRRAQERLLLKPVADQLSMRFGNEEAVALIRRQVAALSPAVRRQSYAGGNLLNLALKLGATEPLDFSGTAIWQVHLRGKTLPPINFSGADFSGADFTDYGGKIQTLAFSPDGKRLAGSAGTGEVRLWDAVSYQLLLTFEGHKDFAGGLCFSPDGRFLVSGGGDGVARLWDAATGTRLHTFPAHDNAIIAVVCAPHDAPGGEWVAGISYNRLSFWDPQSGEAVLDLAFPGGYLNALAVSRDGRMIALGNQRAVLVWDTAATLAAGAGRQLFAFQEHEVLVQRLAFSPDGKWLASSGDRICLWDLSDGRLQHTFSAPNSYLLGLAFHPAGEVLAGGSSDAVYLWRTQTGEMVHAFAAHEQRILSLAYSPDGKTLASASDDQTVRLWDAGCRNMHVIRGYVNMVHTLDISPDGRYLACGTEDQRVRLYDYDNGRILAAWARHNSMIWRVAFSPDGSRLATCSRDRHVLEWAIPGGEAVHRLKSGDARVASLTYSRDGRLLAVGDTRGAVTLWDVATGRPAQTLAHPETICALAFHPQGDRLAVVCFTQEIFVWEAATGRLLQRFAGHDNETWALAYSRDGRFLVSGSDDQTVQVWDMATGECAHTLTGHTGWVQTLAFNRAGDLLATGSQDGRVGLWDVTPLNRCEPPRLLRFLEGHTARVTAVLFAPDDATLISGSLDETMRFWDPATGELRRTWAIPGPYAGMDITGATGLSPAQRRSLKMLGAVERTPVS
jgi:WD40 repeat protein